MAWPFDQRTGDLIPVIVLKCMHQARRFLGQRGALLP